VLSDGTAVALGNEPVLHNEQVVSRVTSGGYGFTVRESLAYAYLPVHLAAPDTPVAIEVDGREIPAAVAREPRYDPTHSRIKG
jgi:4-methylaminobutanoate oxidase (formaldehyde-forming)